MKWKNFTNADLVIKGAVQQYLSVCLTLYLDYENNL